MKMSISRLGFGLSGIAGSGSFSHQQVLIKTAIDCGITHFDVAPYYGSGDAEKILGDVLATCSENVTITTKYGLVPFGGGTGGNSLRSILRPVFRKAAFLKRMALSIVSKVHQPKEVTFTKGALLTSLDESIKKLRRPVTIFLLHDPTIPFAMNEELLNELDEARNTGRTTLTGISGPASVVGEVAGACPRNYSVVQLENSLNSPAPIAVLFNAGSGVITHRAIQGGLKHLAYLIKYRPGFKQIWQREIGVDPFDTEGLAAALIELAISENENGTVLFSTTRPDRIKKISAISSSPVLGREGCRKVRELFDQVHLTTDKLSLAV